MNRLNESYNTVKDGARAFLTNVETGKTEEIKLSKREDKKENER